MSAELHIGRRVARPVILFSDRTDAGRALAEWIDPAPDPDTVVFALPRGGIPVGRPLADLLRCELRPALVRKLPIPFDPEMGFGAAAVDGTVRLNHTVIESFRIPQDTVDRVIAQVRDEVERRGAAYPGGWPLPDMAGRHVWLVDDGLATGLTMLAAADMLRAHGVAALTVAIPCSPSDSLTRLAAEVNDVWCIASQEGHPFAVASFYRDFHDLADAEVLAALR